MSKSLAILITILFASSFIYTVFPVNAQLVDVDVNGVRRVIGYEPVRLVNGDYHIIQQWVPRSMAVYLDGKRCQREVDYIVNWREHLIIFKIKTDENSVVIIDYEPL